MKRILILLLTVLIGVNQAYSYELIFPKEKKNYVQNQYAFFVGKAAKNETISVNNEHVFVAPNGAFAFTVRLKEGENRILLKSDYSSTLYKFYKSGPKEVVKPQFQEFEPELYTVLKDNTPLRKTPVDYGLNRLSHLFEGTNLVLTGEQGSFYRVKLSKNRIAWVAKDAVIKSTIENPSPAKFIAMSSDSFKNGSTHTIEFTDKIPYTLDETEKEIIFKAYNPQVSDEAVYTITMRKPEKYSYNIMLHNGVYIIKVRELQLPEHALDGLNIVIDPGHGGNENGAIGCLGDKEKDINLLIANELKEMLSLMGANVIMTRECDAYVSLNDRVRIAKENYANIFVSIHLNSIGDINFDVHKNKGTSVYYYNNHSKELAGSVLKSLTSSIKTRDDGVRTASFAVIRPTDYIGILVETAYMTNPQDSVLYTSEDFPRNAAQGIANGILDYACGNK